jgi:hypothetical protein
MRFVPRPAAVLAILWALPYTLFGLAVGAVGLCTGGQGRIRGRVIEFHGGAVHWLVARLPGAGGPIAITFGHTVLGRTAAALDISRSHELVHVRQYERWGPAFGPAYLLCSLGLWLRGKRAYEDNPFEQEAFREADRKG